MVVKFTKREIYLILALLLFVGLFLGLALAHNNTIDRLQECATTVKQKHALQCGPKLVNAPGQDLNFSLGVLDDKSDKN